MNFIRRESEKVEKANYIDKLYELVGAMTVKRVEKEKETKLSRRTLKMISLTQSLFNAIKLF